MLKTASPVLHGWNDYKIVKPEIKDYPNDSRRSDPCWILMINGSIKSSVVHRKQKWSTRLIWIQRADYF